MNIFIVTSPFQYICALEAKHHFECKNNILAVINQDTESGIKHQKALINHDEWDHVLYTPRNNRSKNTPKLIKELKRLIEDGDVEYLFFSEYNSWRSNVILTNIQHQTSVHIDDGTMTILDLEDIKKNSIKNKPKAFKNFMLILKGLQPVPYTNNTKDLIVFSIFNFVNEPVNFIENKLTLLKRTSKNHKIYKQDAPIGYIGQGAVGHKNQISEEIYIKRIKSISEQFNRQIIYFPHRAEKPGIRIRLKEIKNLTYHTPKLPLEMELMEEKIHLSSFVGTISTAMFTIKKLDEEVSIYTTSAINESRDTNELIINNAKLMGVKPI